MNSAPFIVFVQRSFFYFFPRFIKCMKLEPFFVSMDKVVKKHNHWSKQKLWLPGHSVIPSLCFIHKQLPIDLIEVHKLTKKFNALKESTISLNLNSYFC